MLFAHPFSCLLGWSQIPSISGIKGRAGVCHSWSSPRSHGKGPGDWEDLLLVSSWPWFLGQKDTKSYMPSTQIHQIFQFVFSSIFFSQEAKLCGWVTSPDLVNGVRYHDNNWDEWGDEGCWHPLYSVKHGACSAEGHLSLPNAQVLHLWAECQKEPLPHCKMVNFMSPGNLTLDSASSVLREITHTLAVLHFQYCVIVF